MSQSIENAVSPLYLSMRMQSVTIFTRIHIHACTAVDEWTFDKLNCPSPSFVLGALNQSDRNEVLSKGQVAGKRTRSQSNVAEVNTDWLIDMRYICCHHKHQSVVAEFTRATSLERKKLVAFVVVVVDFSAFALL